MLPKYDTEKTGRTAFCLFDKHWATAHVKVADVKSALVVELEVLQVALKSRREKNIITRGSRSKYIDESERRKELPTHIISSMENPHEPQKYNLLNYTQPDPITINSHFVVYNSLHAVILHNARTVQPHVPEESCIQG